MPAANRMNTPKLRDGVMKRGTTWSYVIRVKDPETGISKPRWVGGFATEQDAKAARDEAPGEGPARRVHRPEPDHRGGLPGRVDRRSRNGDQAAHPRRLPGLHPALRHAAHRASTDPGRQAVHHHQALP
jgi:hypothetical protein